MGTEIDYSTSVPIVIMGRFVMKIFKYLFTLGCLFFFRYIYSTPIKPIFIVRH